MSKTVNSESSNAPHSVHLFERKHMEIEGVEHILAFDEREVRLNTSSGQMLITGKELKVTSLLANERKANVDGYIDSILYSRKKLRDNHKLLSIFR